MKALIIEFFYEKVSILFAIFIILFLYFIYIPIFQDPEIIISSLASYVFASLYGGIVYKRKNTNFEIFLSTSPLGRKTIINTGYIIGLVSSIFITVTFLIFYFIRKSLIDLEPLNFLSLMSILCSFSTGIITNAILFPTYVLPDKENKFLLNLVAFLTLFICGSFLYSFIIKLDFFNIIVRTLIYLGVSICIYIVSYLITTNKYLKKEF